MKISRWPRIIVSCARPSERQPKPNYRLQPWRPCGTYVFDTAFPSGMSYIKTSDALPRGTNFIKFPLSMAYPDTVCLRQSPLPYFGLLSHMLYFGYLGQTFGALAAKQHICHNVLCFVEDKEDMVVNHELLQPEYSYLGLPCTFTVPHDLYPYLRCNAVAGDHSRRIILDCEIPENTTRVVPQSLFAPYAGLPRSQAELQSASLLPPIFFFRLDHSVGLPLETAKFAESQIPLLLYDTWCPMEGKASIKLRIAVRCLLIIQNRHFSHLARLLQWNGYRPWQTQIQLRNRRKEPITLPRLVQLVANGVERFLRVRSAHSSDVLRSSELSISRSTGLS